MVNFKEGWHIATPIKMDLPRIYLDTKKFPCYQMEVPFHDCEDKDLERVKVNNKVEYLKQLVLNIEKWKKETELHYDKIFSEY